MFIIDVLTVFPEMFDSVINASMLKIAQQKKKVRINLHNMRDYTTDKHRKVDDRPFGGGPGMVIKAEPIYNAIDSLLGKKKNIKKILLSPRGVPFTQKVAKSIIKDEKHIFLICGHYEGIDERVSDIVDMELSVGDYVLTSGEIAALAVIDATVRLIPGVLGDKDSIASESFEENLLEYPHYTRPKKYRDMRVPAVLLNGNHSKIAKWRHRQAFEITMQRRPDLLKKGE